MDITPSQPPWETNALLCGLQRWGARHPKLYYITPPGVWFVWVYVTSMMDLHRRHLDAFNFPGLDKLVHIVYFGMFAVLVIRGWQREKIAPIGLHGFVWLMAVVFGFWIELQQRATGYRSFEWADLAADAAGAVLGLALWHLAMMKWGRRTKLYPGLFRPDFKNSPANPVNRTRTRKVRERT